MATLGERIKKTREAKGLLQSELANLVGVKSGGVISNWETDQNKPDADKLVKLCEVLDVSLSYLLNYYGNKKAPAEQQEQLGGGNISLEASNRLLMALGFIQEGEDLSDNDLAFLTNIIGLLDNWFSSKQR